MIQLTDISKAVTKVLKENFKLPVYADEIKEGYKMPSFFVGIFPVSVTVDTKNIVTTDLIISIDYFSDTKDVVANYKMMHEVRRAFGIVLNVDKRYLTIRDMEIDVTGEDKDIYTFSFRTSYKEVINFENDDDIDKANKLHFRKVFY